jgi:hypothetical protein
VKAYLEKLAGKSLVLVYVGLLSSNQNISTPNNYLDVLIKSIFIVLIPYESF